MRRLIVLCMLLFPFPLNGLFSHFEQFKSDFMNVKALAGIEYHSGVEMVKCYPERKEYSESCTFIICRRPAETQGCDWVYGIPKGAISNCSKK